MRSGKPAYLRACGSAAALLGVLNVPASIMPEKRRRSCLAGNNQRGPALTAVKS